MDVYQSTGSLWPQRSRLLGRTLFDHRSLAGKVWRRGFGHRIGRRDNLQEHTFPHRAVQSLERFSCSQISLWHAMAIGSQALFLIFERSSQMLTHGIFHHILPILQIAMLCNVFGFTHVYPSIPEAYGIDIDPTERGRNMSSKSFITTPGFVTGMKLQCSPFSAKSRGA